MIETPAPPSPCWWATGPTPGQASAPGAEPVRWGKPMTVDADAPPLGVRPEVMLTAAQRRTLQVLQDFDLSPVRERLLRDAVMPSGWVDEAILEFRRYLG